MLFLFLFLFRVFTDFVYTEKVVNGIWDDHERKSTESLNESPGSTLNVSPENDNKNITMNAKSQTPGPPSTNRWHQEPVPSNNTNWNVNVNRNENCNNNYNNNHWNPNNRMSERQRAPRHIRYEQQHRNQHAQTPGPYGNYQNNRAFNFPPGNGWNHNANGNRNGFNQGWSNCNNRWHNNNGNNQRWNGNMNVNNYQNNGIHWSQQPQIQQYYNYPSMPGFTRHRSESPKLTGNLAAVPPPLTISKSWGPGCSQNTDKPANIDPVPSKVLPADPKDQNKSQEATVSGSGSVKIRDKILAAEQKQLETTDNQQNQEEIKLDADESKDKETEKHTEAMVDALKFRNKYLSARCESLEKENESLKKLDSDNKELLKQLDIKHTQIHELRHSMRKMRQFLDTLPIKFRRSFYRDTGNFNDDISDLDEENKNEDEIGNKEKAEKEKEEKEVKEEYDEITQEAMKHTSKGWTTNTKKTNDTNDNKLYRNSQRKYRHNKRRADDQAWRKKK